MRWRLPCFEVFQAFVFFFWAPGKSAAWLRYVHDVVTRLTPGLRDGEVNASALNIFIALSARQ